MHCRYTVRITSLKEPPQHHNNQGEQSPSLNDNVMDKFKFLKRHNSFNAGDVAELPEAQAKYLVRVGVVKPFAESKEKPTKPKKNEPSGKQKDNAKEQ